MRAQAAACLCISEIHIGQDRPAGTTRAGLAVSAPGGRGRWRMVVDGLRLRHLPEMPVRQMRQVRRA